LLVHVIQDLERVIEGRMRKIFMIDQMQFGFMAGKGTTDDLYTGGGYWRSASGKDQ